MYMLSDRRPPAPAPRHRYKDVPVPLRFPFEEEVPEGRRHLRLRTLLFQVLELALEGRSCVGSDQFVYWNARDPGVCLAPDVFVALGVPDEDFLSWKTWERKTPELAFEIVSASDTPEGPWHQKLERYHELGVKELVRFDSEAPRGQRLRIWNRVEENLLEREVEGDRSPSDVLELWWVVVEDRTLGPALRPARDADGSDLLPSPMELQARTQRELEEERRERAQEQRDREALELRVAELDAQLARRAEKL